MREENIKLPKEFGYHLNRNEKRKINNKITTNMQLGTSCFYLNNYYKAITRLFIPIETISNE